MRTPAHTPQAAVLNLLGQVPLFRPLDDSERFEIVRILQPLSHSAGVVLFRQGDPGDRFFVIESGEVEVGFDGADGLEVIARLGPAEVLGEMSLIEGGRRSATARTVTPVTGYSIAIADFDRLRRDLHPAAYKIIRQLSRVVAQRIRRVNEQIESLLEGAPLAPASTGESPPAAAPGAAATPTEGADAPPLREFARTVTGAVRTLLGRVWRSDDDEEAR